MLSASLYVGTTATHTHDRAEHYGDRRGRSLRIRARPARTRRCPRCRRPPARALAFVAILLGGLAGGLIGYASSSCSATATAALPLGLGILAGAVVAAAGMSVVAVLVLRALGRMARAQDRSRRDGRSVVADATNCVELACRLRPAKPATLALIGRRRRTIGDVGRRPSRRPPTWSPSSTVPPRR